MNELIESLTSGNPFEDADIISCYTWDDAIQDGIFIDVTDSAKILGFKIPVAITLSVYDLCNVDEDDENTNRSIRRLLMAAYKEIQAFSQDDSMLTFKHGFDVGLVETVWVKIEARSPKNPEPVITIMLPSDY